MVTGIPLLASAVLAVALLAGSASASHDHHIPGSQLYTLCTQNMGAKGSELEAGECMGYIVGIADSFDCQESDHGHHWNPAAAGGCQISLVATVLQWMDKHPEHKALEAHRIIGAALEQAFPCKKADG